MPLGVLIILVAMPCVAIVLGSRALLLRRLSPIEIDHAEKVVPFLLGTVGSLYGLVAGFTLSNSWTELRGLRGAMTAEVSALADMMHIARNLPKPAADGLRAATGRYLETVVDSELPLMVKGRISPATTRALLDIWGAIARHQPRTAWEGTLHGIAVDKVMAIGEQRRLRIVFSRERLPPVLWWILIGSSFVIVAGATIASLSHERPAAVFLGALVAVLVAVLLSIHFLERPFQYRMSSQAGDYLDMWKVLGGASPP